MEGWVGQERKHGKQTVVDRYYGGCVYRQLETVSLSYPRGNSRKVCPGLTEPSENGGNCAQHRAKERLSTCPVCNKHTAYTLIQIHHHILRFMREIVAVSGEKDHAEIPTRVSLSIKSSGKSIDKAEKSER